VSAGALDGVAGTIVEVVLLLLILPFMNLDLNVDAGSDLSALGWIILAFAIAVVAAAIVLIVKRAWREKLVHLLKEAFDTLKVVLVAPAKLVRLFGGNVLTEIGWALTLCASAHAYGADLGLAQALVVNMCASVFASIMPVPGGIGVAEASLAAGMMAFGVPSSEAYAAALTHRLATGVGSRCVTSPARATCDADRCCPQGDGAHPRWRVPHGLRRLLPRGSAGASRERRRPLGG
jgi:uncharacterized membrane protein YbhN (UPF0104 family)